MLSSPSPSETLVPTSAIDAADPEISADTEADPSRRVRPSELCFLSRTLIADFAPHGFCGWEITLAPSVARDASGWIPVGAAGRLLFHADPEQVFRHPPGVFPDRTVPLLLWLTHRSLRVLYGCTPTEAYALGQRLATLGARAVGAPTVEECSPAVMADLLRRWVEGDPETPVLYAGELAPRSRLQLTPWYPVWEDDQAAALPTRAELSDRARYLPPLHLRWRKAEVLTYDDGPVTLAPVSFMLDEEISQEALQSLYHSVAPLDRQVYEPLLCDTYGTVVAWTIPRLAAFLAPLRESGWRGQLTEVRDRLGARFDSGAACLPVRPQALLGLVDLFHGIQKDLIGVDELAREPLPDARTTPAEGARARELRRRLSNAVALPFADAVIHPLPA